ncbi:MAG: hypothetical protein NVS2B12_11100 [Ktedonobacteraceae bacterium]
MFAVGESLLNARQGARHINERQWVARLSIVCADEGLHLWRRLKATIVQQLCQHPVDSGIPTGLKAILRELRIDFPFVR